MKYLGRGRGTGRGRGRGRGTGRGRGRGRTSLRGTLEILAKAVCGGGLWEKVPVGEGSRLAEELRHTPGAASGTPGDNCQLKQWRIQLCGGEK